MLLDQRGYDMSRAEMRRQQREAAKAGKMYNLNVAQIQSLKQNATDEAVSKAFTLMLAIPVMVLHDKYGQLMKKDGREERFAELCLDLYDSYEKGYVTFEDLKACLEEETGMKIER